MGWERVDGSGRREERQEQEQESGPMVQRRERGTSLYFGAGLANRAWRGPGAGLCQRGWRRFGARPAAAEPARACPLALKPRYAGVRGWTEVRTGTSVSAVVPSVGRTCVDSVLSASPTNVWEGLIGSYHACTSFAPSVATRARLIRDPSKGGH